MVDNDGWEHVDETDLFTLHDYARTGADLEEKYGHLTTEPDRIPRNGREALVQGAAYNGTPILMTEFGGVAYRVGKETDEKAVSLEPCAGSRLQPRATSHQPVLARSPSSDVA